MANRRNLKKDINWLTDEVITDCLLYMEFNPDKNNEKLVEIVNEIITKRDELISKINKPTSKLDPKEVKKQYVEVVKTLFKTADNCFESLSKLSKK
ncbi:MAG TPA: hypothetical protein PLL66_02115 [Bacteroidales bacterium]|nr:hypothetical protein [Bacteroidales bacterium]